jgi:hypothetical protein
MGVLVYRALKVFLISLFVIVSKFMLLVSDES